MDETNRQKWAADMEKIYQAAMDKGQLTIALKAKEILGKTGGFLNQKPLNKQGIKPLFEWSEEEIQHLIHQLETEK